MRLFVLISILIHILIGYPVLKDKDGVFISPEERENKSFMVSIVEMSNKSTKKQSSQKNSSKEDSVVVLNKKQEEIKTNDCSKFYFGIGIIVVPVFIDQKEYIEIFRVVKGYSGENIGLMKGDVILNSSKPLVGDSIEELTLTILRGKEIIEKTVLRSKVCIAD